MSLKIIVDKAAKSDPDMMRIFRAVEEDSNDEQLDFAYRFQENMKANGGRLSLEAGMLVWGGAEHPVIGMRMPQRMLMYVTGESCVDFFTKAASMDDNYHPGPKVTIKK